MAAEPMPAYAVSGTLEQPSLHPTAPFIHDPETDESFDMDVNPELGARRAEWGRQHFDRLLAEAEKMYGYEKGNDYTVEQYFGILRYSLEKCYEAIPGD